MFSSTNADDSSKEGMVGSILCVQGGCVDSCPSYSQTWWGPLAEGKRHIDRDVFFSVAQMSRHWWKSLQSRFPYLSSCPEMKWPHSTCAVPEQLRQRLNGNVDTVQVSIKRLGSRIFNLGFLWISSFVIKIEICSQDNNVPYRIIRTLKWYRVLKCWLLKSFQQPKEGGTDFIPILWMSSCAEETVMDIIVPLN